MARTNAQKQEKKCPVCEQTFLGFYDRKYCSDTCKDKNSNKRKKFIPEERNCKYCGTKFIARRKDTIYCNNKCKERYRKGVPLDSNREKVRKRQQYVIFSGLLSKGSKPPSVSDYQVFGETLDKKIVAMTAPMPLKEASVQLKKLKEEVYSTDSRDEYVSEIVSCWLCKPAKPCPHKPMHNGKTCMEAVQQ